ncbi:MAG: hypothetical protein U0X87_14040 [Anaerolineales bacterium]
MPTLIVRVDFPTHRFRDMEWMQDPIKRNLWNGGHVTWSLGDRPKGRAGAGMSNHCAHGKSKSTEVILDWRPFEYSTADSYENGKKFTGKHVPLSRFRTVGRASTCFKCTCPCRVLRATLR